jgi:hypothetical protein
MSQPPAPPPGRRAAHGEELPPPTRNQVLATAAEYAVHAPSLHDIQPWQIERHPDHLAIRAGRSRQPAGLDPKGRELVESAGAVLFNVRVALLRMPVPNGTASSSSTSVTMARIRPRRSSATAATSGTSSAAPPTLTSSMP